MIVLNSFKLCKNVHTQKLVFVAIRAQQRKSHIFFIRWNSSLMSLLQFFAPKFWNHCYLNIWIHYFLVFIFVRQLKLSSFESIKQVSCQTLHCTKCHHKIVSRILCFIVIHKRLWWERERERESVKNWLKCLFSLWHLLWDSVRLDKSTTKRR